MSSALPQPLPGRVLANSSPEPNSGCWLWLKAVDKDGYGTIKIGSMRDGTRRQTRAHRTSYEAFVGPIPDGLEIDHKCRVRCCVNPAHLEPVTSLENTYRSPIALGAINGRMQICAKGHALTENNLVPSLKGQQRRCLTCFRAYDAARKRAARRAA